MALAKAMKFVDEAIVNKELRDKCSEFETHKDLLNYLDFNSVEFDDAVNMALVKCNSANQAEYYYQLRMWFKLL